MKNLIISSVLFLFTTAIFGQFRDFDLSNQKLGDYTFEGLGVSFDFQGNHSNSEFDYSNFNQKNSETNFSNNLGGNYSKIVNNRKTQMQQSASLNLYGTSNKSSDSEKEISNSIKGFEGRLGFRKLFYNKKNWFLGVGSNVRGQYQIEKIDTLNVYKTDFNTYNLNVDVPLSIGIGRVENVTDAWRAYRTFEDLHRFGILERMPNDDEITDLANLNTTRQNWRFFDARLKQIEDIKLLANHFLEGGFVKEENNLFYTSIFDMWRFGTNTMRFSGKRLELSFIPNFTGRLYKDFRNNLTDQELVTFSIQPSYSIFKPINLKWQLDLSAGLISDFRAITGTNYEHGHNSVFVNSTVGFYPNSRTSITGHLSVFSGLPGASNIGDSGQYFDFVRFTGRLNAYYYISPQTRLNAILYYSNQNEYDVILNEVENSYSARGASYDIGFTHLFF